MEWSIVDGGVFVGFVAVVITVGILMSRHEKDSEGYFLAGRGLKWWLIGFSLIAANISAEQFVGMSGSAAKDHVGLAIASYEWCAAVTLVVVAFFFLPKFLRSGIYTIPEYLQYRYNRHARTIMSLLMVVTLVCVNITTVIYLGAKALEPLFEDVSLFNHSLALDIRVLSWIVGVAAALYVAFGGLKACAWTDLFWGSALIIGGAIIMVLAFMALDAPEKFDLDPEQIGLGGELADAGVFEKFDALNSDKMHMVLPADNPEIPWTALVLGIWIPNFYYWGLNQYIMQRTFGAHSLADGQRGVVFAAFMKLLIPFIVCVPGIIAFSLYRAEMQENASSKTNAATLSVFDNVKGKPEASDRLFKFNDDYASLYPDRAREILDFNAAVLGADVPTGEKPAELNAELLKHADEAEVDYRVQTELVGYDYDGAFPLLIRYLTPSGLRGFVLAALIGAVVSSLAAMLNAASTIFTMDVYKEYFNKNASQGNLVLVGRCCVPVAVLVGCLIAPELARPEFQGAFHFIQEFQGYISPGVLTVFLFGLFVPRTPRICGALGLLLCPLVYGALHLFWGDLAFLNRMAITVGVLTAVLGAITALRPLRDRIILPEQADFDMTSSKGAKICGVAIVILTVALYVIFW